MTAVTRPSIRFPDLDQAENIGMIVTGDISLGETTRAFRSALSALITRADDGQTIVIVCAGNTSFCDSATRSLADLHQLALDKGVTLVIVSDQANRFLFSPAQFQPEEMPVIRSSSG